LAYLTSKLINSTRIGDVRNVLPTHITPGTDGIDKREVLPEISYAVNAQERGSVYSIMVKAK